MRGVSHGTGIWQAADSGAGKARRVRLIQVTGSGGSPARSGELSGLRRFRERARARARRLSGVRLDGFGLAYVGKPALPG